MSKPVALITGLAKVLEPRSPAVSPNFRFMANAVWTTDERQTLSRSLAIST